MVGLLVSPNASLAQSPVAGVRDANGRILTKVVVTMKEPGAFGRPAPDLVFLVVGQDGDRISMRTNEAGVASTWLAPGDYRFVTPDPYDWDGNLYTWDRIIPVNTRTGVIQLSQDEARSISVSTASNAATSRTSEPEALSSKPTLWKAATPPTQDLRVASSAPARAASSPAKVVSAPAEARPATVPQPSAPSQSAPAERPAFVPRTATLAPAYYESESRTQGLHFGIALNGTATKLDDEDFGESDTNNGGGLSLYGGYNFTPNLGVFLGVTGASINAAGGGSFGLGHADLGVRVSLADAAFVPYIEAAYSGLSLQGDIDTDDIELQGTGFTGALGFNFFVTQRAALDLNFKYVTGEFNTVKVNGQGLTNDDGVGLATGRFNLGVAFYP